MQLDGIDAIQQILAEVSFVHQPADVCIGGADEPHINGRSLRTSQTTDTTLFDGSQQFGLHGQRKVTYLVQKSVPPVATSIRPAFAFRASVNAPFS